MPTLKIIIHNNQFEDMQNMLKNYIDDNDKEVNINDTYKELVEEYCNVPLNEFIETYLSHLKYLLESYVNDNKYGKVLDIDKKLNCDKNGLNSIEILTDKPNDVIDFFHTDEIFDENFFGMTPYIETKFNSLNKEEIEKLSQREIQKLIDDALDNKDFDILKMLRPYLKESHIMNFEDYNKMKKS